MSVSAGERGLMFLGIDNGDPRIKSLTLFSFILRYLWTCFYQSSFSKLQLIFLNTVCALSLSDVSIIESLLLTLSRWQSFPSKLEHFLIQNTFRQPPLLWLLVTSAMNQYLTLKINHTDKRLVFQIICIYRYSKSYSMLNFMCIFCL